MCSPTCVRDFFLCLLTADPLTSLDEAEAALEQTLMGIVFQNLTPEEEQDIMGNQRNVCGGDRPWKYMQCTAGKLSSIGILYKQISPIEIEFFPPTVKVIVICGCAQRARLNVRAFPREAMHINLSSNSLFGHIDLVNLPMRLQYFNVSQNRLDGPIDLTNLPSTMKEIDVSGNRIKQHVVYYGRLPSSIRRISLGKNSIGIIAPRDPLDVCPRKDIFWKTEERVN
ncbi:leucine-rich repeat protein [Perkinsela sp. CCAP 1560/4]|nr:leucine-rich repeat protein [Perkinsela sp. CCAP 1560/4]|eukprot:KNH03855.1 leucine-rich repeat protein [Perkinsela sp. CCAP 1560/4]